MPLDKKNKVLVRLAALLLCFLPLLALPAPGGAEERGYYAWTGKTAEDAKNLSQLCFMKDITSSDVLWANDYSEKNLPPQGTVLTIPASKNDVLVVWQKGQNKTKGDLVTVKLHGVPSFMRDGAPAQTSPTPVAALPAKRRELSATPAPKPRSPSASLQSTPKPALQNDKITLNEDARKRPADPLSESGQSGAIRLLVSGDQVIIRREPGPARSGGETNQSFSNIRLPPPVSSKFTRPSSKMLWPVSGRISSPFGKRGRRGFHSGVDIPMPKGTPIRAALDGVVSEAIPQRSRGFRGYGNAVIIDHGNGLSTLYAHCLKFNVKKGQRIRQGDVIATVGRTGRATTDHVHFEVRVNGRPVNPMSHLSSRP